MVGRRGEAPLVPPYILCNFKLGEAVFGNGIGLAWQSRPCSHCRDSRTVALEGELF